MKSLWIGTILLSLALPVVAQERSKSEQVTPENDRPASDAHSFMELFTKLERDLEVAAQSKAQVSLEALVAPEFIERSAVQPELSVRRSEWMGKVLPAYRLDPVGIRSMVIRAFLGNAIVSFVQKQAAGGPGAAGTREYFIVDLWVVNQGRWRLASRFVSPVGAAH